MNRMLILTTLALSFNLAACASQVDEPLRDAIPNDAEHPVHLDVAQGYSPAEPSHALSDSSDDPPTVPERPYVGPELEHVVSASHPVLPAVAARPPVTWDDLLVCIICVADRIKAETPAAP